ncbi:MULTISPECIES: hydantoinase B/oxoprolinase family protein [Thalassospira]|uniref:5-oxoprolinase n=1 Tax=Thalassospira profundimaris TaxID=502049 RepID=A0A367VMQ7_9PROT|nr:MULTISPECIES: hydantoinase B/oxoprolinase family protein [Thalassospira]KZB71688.1 5-oxoprolinase [Thalassospira sp. MCCC 1A01148]MBR9899635.1 5-oxoprolinase [Rhodospirillales bacterium]RCK25692.1 5-oxoprolinase [Thalassospira profundimaris]
MAPLDQKSPNSQTTGQPKWQFWIDRGGTFTDIVARKPNGALVTHKLLSENPERYKDAAIQGIRELLEVPAEEKIPAEKIEAVKMGTTVATNALLERKGDRTVLVTNKGFRDALRLAYQNRPRLFDRNIILPETLYETVIETAGRFDAQGKELEGMDLDALRADLQKVYDSGIRACAIVFMHGYRYTAHELAAEKVARDIGFTQVSVSHQVSPLMKLVSRGDTTVVDAYLSPILRRYVEQVAGELGGVKLMFMQSNGGLTDAVKFQGKDAILSGPAGGVVGMVRTAEMDGYKQVIGFDMGGTSTDVSHYDGEYERDFETQVAGVRMRAPMMKIHTVAAGGGSILHFDGARFRVGPDSAGANPGPAAYRRGGPLAVTDINVMLGKVQPDFFPNVFGPEGDEPLNAEAVRKGFEDMAADIEKNTGQVRTPEEVAEGFLRIAVENMANAIKQISVQRGYDVSDYILQCFGGAGGQHACQVADTLGMTKVFVHPFAGVLSAYGMGLADIRAMREQAVEGQLAAEGLADLDKQLDALAVDALAELKEQGIGDDKIRLLKRLHLRYDGTDTPLIVDFGDVDAIKAQFEEQHKQRYGFVMSEKPLVVEAVAVEAIGETQSLPASSTELDGAEVMLKPLATRPVVFDGKTEQTPFYKRENLKPGATVRGPAVIVEPVGTTVIDPGWEAKVNGLDHLILTRVVAMKRTEAIGTQADPVMLEVFNNLFMNIAEQMGVTLANTSYSVNIKERLDFSCAVFDQEGLLIANAPHMPVHLGSMGESVQAVIKNNAGKMKPGDVYMLNDPYNGGTHLPDITLITPVFGDDGKEVLFYVASRGHHADVGGITPGSMAPNSRVLEEEGVLINNFKLVDQGTFDEKGLTDLLEGAKYPARNPYQNIADLRAQIAANEKGVQELRKMVEHFGLDVVHAYMQHVQDNAEESVRRVIDVLKDGEYAYEMDNGAVVRVKVTIDKASRSATVDFTGTSDQLDNNFNAPSAVTRAAVLYVFRTLVDDDIPLNAGCLKPVNLIVPEGSMLNPRYPAAVVAGNVETSMHVTDTLYAALGVLSGGQGTMNNFTWGNDTHQYYETICGGTGAGPDFDGTAAVHSHMTNSRLTDPEVLEWRFPVLLESFEIRKGSGGNGKHKGGDGAIRRVRFLEDMTASILSNHRRVPGQACAGGEPGKLGRNAVERVDGTVIELKGTDGAEMHAGDVFIIETPGGGGYGKA